MKKRMFTMGLTMAMAAMLITGCGAGNAEGEKKAKEKKGDEALQVAIVKQMDHASLDEIAEAVAKQLDTISEEKGIEIAYDIYSGQGEQTTLKQIGDQVVMEGVDAIIPVATLAAQVMTACAEDAQIPVVYAAVSDPQTAELTDIEYVTGTSDALNTEYILEMLKLQNPDVKKVGLLYSLSEPNAQKPIAEAKELLENAKIEYVEQTAATNDEVIAAASSLIAEKVDAIFTPTDNVIMSAELAIYEALAKAKIPHYTGADSFVRNGAFITCGVNYTELGRKTADLAYKAMTEGMEKMEDVYLMDGGIITVNEETAEMLGINPAIFADLGEIVEVKTTEK